MSKELVIAKDISESDLQLIKDTVAKGASDSELALFLGRAKTLGLNPLAPGEIYFVKYQNNPGTIIVGIQGFRKQAAKSGKHVGTTRGVLKDAGGKTIGAWAEVFRSDWKHPAREEVSMQEYNKGRAQWKEMPETMLKKCAECAALRMAFPDECGGIYGEDERHVIEASNHRPVVQPEPLQIENLTERPEFETVITEVEPPANFAPQTAGAYIFKTGNARKGKPLTAFNKERLHSFIADVDKMVADGKTVADAVQEDYNAALEFLCGEIAPAPPA